jgi:putative SOS response-associated peptidase YedK
MPVVFDKQMEAEWLEKNISEVSLLNLLKPYPASKINIYTVSPRINETGNEHPSLILPAPSSDQYGNLTLFD